MKLKTLKDLEELPVETSITAYKRIKQEAIKWVKEWLKTDKECWGCSDNSSYLLFMKFHNITEDDLKSPEGEE